MAAEQHTGEFGGTIPGTRGRALPTKVSTGSNATRQRKAQARMSLMEATCGITLEQFDADMAAPARAGACPLRSRSMTPFTSRILELGRTDVASGGVPRPHRGTATPPRPGMDGTAGAAAFSLPSSSPLFVHPADVALCFWFPWSLGA